MKRLLYGSIATCMKCRRVYIRVHHSKGSYDWNPDLFERAMITSMFALEFDTCVPLQFGPICSMHRTHCATTEVNHAQ